MESVDFMVAADVHIVTALFQLGNHLLAFDTISLESTQAKKLACIQHQVSQIFCAMLCCEKAYIHPVKPTPTTPAHHYLLKHLI